VRFEREFFIVIAPQYFYSFTIELHAAVPAVVIRFINPSPTIVASWVDIGSIFI